MNKSRLLILVGSFALIVGGFLPWISVSNLFGLSGPSYEGIAVGWEGDGFLTAAIGLILLLGELFLRGMSHRRFTLIGGFLAILAASVVFLDFRRILEIAPEAGFFAATDIGIYVTLAGALLVLIGCFFKRVPASIEPGEQRVATTGTRY